MQRSKKNYVERWVNYPIVLFELLGLEVSDNGQKVRDVTKEKHHVQRNKMSGVEGLHTKSLRKVEEVIRKYEEALERDIPWQGAPS
jgi:hypothetical protein